MTKHPPEAYRRACDRLLVAMLGDEYASQWWTRYNKHWQKTPEEAFKDDPAGVYDYLMIASYGGW